MSEFRKTGPDETYFITLTVMGWKDLFTRESYKKILVENLDYCQKNEGLEIFAYVIMSNHLHLVCRRRDKNLSELLGRFKGYTSKALLNQIIVDPNESRKEWMLDLFHKFALNRIGYSRYRLWNYSNYPILLYSNKVIDQKVEYIHNNPVRAGIVREAQDYIYSSACESSPLVVCEF